MFNKNSLIGFLFAFIICVFSLLYYKFFLETKEEFLLDNPTEKSLKVTLNDKNYILGPGQSIKVDVKEGKNQISSSLENGRIILSDTFFTLHHKRRGLINPSLSSYYTFKRYYGRANVDSIYKAHKTIIDNKEYIGDITKYDDLLIQNFYLNINQDFPKLVNKVDTLEYRIKLFRKNQLLEFYQLKYE